MAIVYKHINPNNHEVYYIGIGKSINRAYQFHNRSNFHSNMITKYGVEVIILYENISWESACCIEKQLIAQYGRRDIGTGILVNQTDGGDGLCNPSPELRTASSIRTKEWYKNLSDEEKSARRDSASLREMGNQKRKGKPHSAESKQKMCEAAKLKDKELYKKESRCKKIADSKKGKPRSDETKKKLSDAFKGKSYIERYGELRAEEIGNKIGTAQKGQKRPKQSVAMKGRLVGINNPMYGKHHTDEFKQRRREYMINQNPGKNKSDLTRKRLSEAKKGIPNKARGIKDEIVSCCHCGKLGGMRIMHRWHFDNCKFKNNEKIAK